MDNEPDVIKEQMEETRVSLTDKIETLENTLKDTVQTTLSSATHVVENVEHTVEAVKDTVEDSAEAVRETVENTLQAVKRNVKEAFNVNRHVQRHPWAMMGAAVAVGFLGGRLFFGSQGHRRVHRQRREEFDRFRRTGVAMPSPGSSPARFSAPPPSPAATAPSEYQAEEARTEEQGPSWVSQLANTFGDELNTLKGLALGTAVGVLRDMITTSAPEQFKTQLTDVFNNITTKLGGKPIQGPVVEPGDGSQQRGGTYGQRNQPEMGRSVGSAYRQGETTVG